MYLTVLFFLLVLECMIIKVDTLSLWQNPYTGSLTSRVRAITEGRAVKSLAVTMLGK